MSDRIKGKACILTTVHPVFSTRILYREAKSLVAAGYNVDLVVPADQGGRVEGVEILAIPRLKSRLKRILILPWKALLVALHKKADVYHFHDPELIGIGLVLRLLRKCVIYDVHEDLPRQVLAKKWIPRIFRRPLGMIVGIVESGAALSMSGIIAATPAIAQRFPSKKTVVVQNFPGIEELKVDRTLPYKKRPPWVVYVGGISRLRGVYEMAKAMSLVNPQQDARLFLAGSPQPLDLTRKAEALGGEGKVEFTGHLSREEVAELLGSARIGLAVLHSSPNHLNSYPVKLFEYMAAGLPVIVSDFPLWKEIVEGNGCGLTVNPLGPKEIAEAIAYLLNHPDEAQQMGVNGRKAILKKYNWERESEKLVKLYEGLLRK